MSSIWKVGVVTAGLVFPSIVHAQLPVVDAGAASIPNETASKDEAPDASTAVTENSAQAQPLADSNGPAGNSGASNKQAEASKSDNELTQLRREVEKLRNEFEESRSSTATADTYEHKVDIYGFMDMGFQKIWANSYAASLGTGTSRAGTFVLGNINLYIDANPTQNWRALTELRLTNYPNGSLDMPGVPALGQAEQRSNTTVFDVNSPDPGWNQVNWGSIVLEQAWIQGTITDWFGVRVGYWLTPFGIWNIDHGTPTLIGLTPPQFTRGHFYPQHQLGAQIRGQVTSRAWVFDYTAYISNGKTSGNLDPTNDKAFGLRLSAHTMRPFPMTFGLAGYTGRYSQQVTNSSTQVPLGIESTETVAYRQWDVGADVSLDINSFRIRTELAVERIDYDAGKLEPALGIPGQYWPNRLIWGWYSIAAYQLPWLGLEPYLSCELYRYPTPLSEAVVVPGAGLNIHINTEVQIKSQFTRAHFFDFNGAADHSYQDVSMFATRLVIAY